MIERLNSENLKYAEQISKVYQRGFEEIKEFYTLQDEIDGILRFVNGRNVSYFERLFTEKNFLEKMLNSLSDEIARDIYFFQEKGKVNGVIEGRHNVIPITKFHLAHISFLYSGQKGIGTALLKRFIEDSLNIPLKNKEIILNVSEYNTNAIRFYEKHGFQNKGKEYKFYNSLKYSLVPNPT